MSEPNIDEQIEWVRAVASRNWQVPPAGLELQAIAILDTLERYKLNAAMLERAERELERAERALLRNGFQDLGGEDWKPPVNELAARLWTAKPHLVQALAIMEGRPHE